MLYFRGEKKIITTVGKIIRGKGLLCFSKHASPLALYRKLKSKENSVTYRQFYKNNMCLPDSLEKFRHLQFTPS